MAYVKESSCVTPLQQDEDSEDHELAQIKEEFLSVIEMMWNMLEQAEVLYAKVFKLRELIKSAAFYEVMPEVEEFMTSLQQKSLEWKEDMPPKGFEWDDADRPPVDVVLACEQLVGKMKVHLKKLMEVVNSFMEVFKKMFPEYC